MSSHYNKLEMQVWMITRMIRMIRITVGEVLSPGARSAPARMGEKSRPRRASGAPRGRSSRTHAVGASLASREGTAAPTPYKTRQKRRLRRPQADPERAQGARGFKKCLRPRREIARPGPATRAARVAPTHGITGAAAPRETVRTVRRLEPALRRRPDAPAREHRQSQ